MDEERDRRCAINRDPLTVREFLQIGLQTGDAPTERRKTRQWCTETKCVTFLRRRFPFLHMMRNYKKEWLVNDVIGGLCVAVLQIPQSLGFAINIGIPPAIGLYVSLYSSLVYFFFGTSMHTSMGSQAVLTLLLDEVIGDERAYYLTPTITPNVTQEGTISTMTVSLSTLANVTLSGAGALDKSMTEDIADDVKVEILAALTFLVGFLHVTSSCFQLGLIAEFFSPQFLNGFIVASSIHVLSVEVPLALGISEHVQSEGHHTIPLPFIWAQIFASLSKTNYVDVLCFCLSLFVLVLTKEFISVKYKNQLKFPIPIEFLVALMVCLISYLAKLSSADVQIVGPIKTGLTAPQLPSFVHSDHYIKHMFSVAVVIFAYNISLAKTVGKKYSYVVKDNQELFAYGVCNIVVSLFRGYPCAGASARTYILDGVKAKTLVSSLISAAFLVLVCLGLSHVFQYLPLSCVAAMYVASYIPLQREYLALPKLYRNNKYDFGVWILTWLAVIITNLTYGLLVGFILSFVTVLVRARLTKIIFLHKSKIDDIFEEGNDATHDLLTILDNDYCERNFGLKNVYVVKYNSFLFFGNVVHFISQLQKLLTVIAKIELNFQPHHEDGWKSLVSTHLKRRTSLVYEDHAFTVAVILDCSAVCYIDTAAALALKNIVSECCKESHVCLALAGCNRQVLHNLLDMESDLPHFFYPTVLDAIQSVSKYIMLKTY